MNKLYSLIFYLGIFTSLYSGIGVKVGFVDPSVATVYGLMGIFGTGLGYAGMHYFKRKKQVESGQYYKEMKSRADKINEKKKRKAKNK